MLSVCPSTKSTSKLSGCRKEKDGQISLNSSNRRKKRGDWSKNRGL